MDKKLLQDIVRMVKEIMKVDITALKRETKINTIPTWDSFNNLMLISKFQEDFGIEFTALDIENTQTIGDLLAFLEKKAPK